MPANPAVMPIGTRMNVEMSEKIGMNIEDSDTPRAYWVENHLLTFTILVAACFMLTRNMLNFY